VKDRLAVHNRLVMMASVDLPRTASVHLVPLPQIHLMICPYLLAVWDSVSRAFLMMMMEDVSCALLVIVLVAMKSVL